LVGERNIGELGTDKQGKKGGGAVEGKIFPMAGGRGRRHGVMQPVATLKERGKTRRSGNSNGKGVFGGRL